MLLALVPTASAQCSPGSLFEDCAAFKSCLARPSECLRLDIQDAPCVAPMDGGGGPWSEANCSRGIVGTIPSSIGTLTALQQLSIGETGISGTIPMSIGNCVALNTIRIASAPPLAGSDRFREIGALSGTLPPSMNSLTRLTAIRIYNTQLSGTLPLLDKLTLLNNLNVFALPRLTGTVPDWIATLGSSPAATDGGMVIAALNDNGLSGTIPEALFQLTGLRDSLSLAGNRLSGTISEELGQLTRLQRLDFSNNLLSGSLPDGVAALTMLQLLDISNNSLSRLSGRMCAVRDRMAVLGGACYLGENELRGDSGDPFYYATCPVCLNTGICNAAPHTIFPNKVRIPCFANTCFPRTPMN